MASALAPEPALTKECFVCCEPCELDSPCNCTDRALHDACLLQMVESTGRNACPACLAPFPNVRIVTQKKVRLTRCGKLLAVLWIADFMLLVACVTTLVCFLSNSDWAVRGWLVPFFVWLALLVAASLAICYTYLRARRTGTPLILRAEAVYAPRSRNVAQR